MAQTDSAQKFQGAVDKVRIARGDGAFKLSNECKRRRYALFCQVIDGDVASKKPGMLDLVGRFKYQAWASVKRTGRAEAMRQCIADVANGETQYR